MSVPLLWQFDLGHVVETEVDKILQKLFSHMGLDGLTTVADKLNFMACHMSSCHYTQGIFVFFVHKTKIRMRVK